MITKVTFLEHKEVVYGEYINAAIESGVASYQKKSPNLHLAN